MPRRFDPHPPLSPEGREAITNLVRHGNALIEQRKQLGDPTVQQVQPLAESDIEVLLDAVVNLDCGAPSFAPPMSFAHVGDNLTTAFQGAEHLEPAHLARLFALYGAIRFDPPVRFDWGAVRILEFLHTGPLADCSLSDFAALFEAVGIDPGVFAIAYLDSHWPTLRWDEEGTWRYFSAHLDKLAAALRGRSQWNAIADPQCTVNALHALHALDCFPRVPPPLLDELWRMALGSAKTHRGRAQTVVQKEPDAFERVLAALSDSRHATRAVAAEWLGRWGLPEAVPALRKALAAEKHDLAIDAQLTALERLGVSIDDVLSPATLTEEAARKLAKMGPPSELSWMPFESLPAVRWRGSAEQIPQQTLTWWLAQAVKLKSPEPGPLLRRQLRLLHPEDRETLGRAILQSWMDYDTMPMTYEQVRQAAERQHAQLRKLHESIPGLDWELPSLEDYERQMLHQPAGSAIKSKGLLAFAAACGGDAVVELAITFIRKWYGLRAAQSKALVQALGWIETPQAIQFLTATAKSFRTKGVQIEAHKALEGLAARRGWTVDELADRMVPDAGLDSAGRLTLDFGARSFVAELDPGFRLQVRDEEGKLRKDLPKPAKADDEEHANQARQSFSAAKKQIRTVVREQTDRLFGAMCAEREWPLANWRAHLLAHPIVGRLCSQLVWRAVSGEGTSTLRPVGAAEWVDAQGGPVLPPDDARTTLAHDVTVPPAQAVAWLEHFADRALEPLFPQLNRGLPELDAVSLSADSIDDFDGVQLGANALRNIAKKLGYARGQGIDGPTFYDYRRSFPSLGLDVSVEFSGQDFLEPDRPVTLERMTFWRRDDHSRVPLGAVPRILLLESYRDLREIALTGAAPV